MASTSNMYKQSVARRKINIAKLHMLRHVAEWSYQEQANTSETSLCRYTKCWWHLADDENEFVTTMKFGWMCSWRRNFSMISWTCRKSYCFISKFIRLWVAGMFISSVHLLQKNFFLTARPQHSPIQRTRTDCVKPDHVFRPIYLRMLRLESLQIEAVARLRNKHKYRFPLFWWVPRLWIFTHSTQSLLTRQHTETAFAFIILRATFNFRSGGTRIVYKHFPELITYAWCLNTSRRSSLRETGIQLLFPFCACALGWKAAAGKWHFVDTTIFFGNDSFR